MEQDPPFGSGGSSELPTYDELAAQNGPNSRFGRWKGWVEKRAAERYAEDTPERREARRMRGWGPHVDVQPADQPLQPESLLSPPSPNLSRTRTVLSSSAPSDVEEKPLPSMPYITTGQALTPSHLKLHTFGSRFLPHSKLPILSFLPLFNDTKLLIGHMDGLSVLDMDSEASLSEVGSKEPRRRDIWHGEGVYQLALLEYEQLSIQGTPQGVILALVGAEPPESGSDRENKEPYKSIRMYNLASLASITRWAATRKDYEPLDLGRLGNGKLQQPAQTKKHKHHHSLSRNLKLSKQDSIDTSLRGTQASFPQRTIPPPLPPKDRPTSSPSSSSPNNKKSSPHRGNSAGSDWDVVGHDDLPFIWATDYVPLASPNSRLAHQSVLFFELHRATDRGRVTARLAIATKQNILLYETVRGERAFRFVKEFYTPIPAQSATFIYQSQQDPVRNQHPATSLSPVHSATYSSISSLGPCLSESSSRRASSPVPITTWSRHPASSGQLSLFVVFEKKAGIIRVSDSAVGEIDLWEASHSNRLSGHSPVSGGSFRRSIGNLESLSLTREKGLWAPPAEITLPLESTMPQNFSFPTETVTVYLLTRGKHTHIVLSPLPMPLASHAPLKVLQWGMHPTHVVPRVCEHPATAAPFLQVTAVGDDGVEVQELSLAFLCQSVGKGKARDDTVVVQAEVGPGGAGFLCMGGHWSEHGRHSSDHPNPLHRHVTASTASTVDTLDLVERRTREQGFYAWTQQGYDDWRVFWLGGDSRDEDVPAALP